MFGVFTKIDNIGNWWSKHGFEALIGLSIFSILVLALCRIGKKGSWSKSYMYRSRERLDTGNYSPMKRVIKESSGESECRRVLQEIFRLPFKSARPDFLKNPVTGNRFNLEIDCYCPELKLGVEYQGAQHYKYIPYFHKNKEAFRNQCYRDDMKKRMCRDHGVRLIEVPHTVRIPDIRAFIVKKCREFGYKI